MSEQLMAALALVASGLALTAIGPPIARRIHPGRSVFFARWGFSHVGLALLAFLLGSVLVGAIPQLVESKTLDLFWRSEVVLALLALLAMRWSVDLHPEGVRALGLAPDRNASAAALGLVVLLLVLPVIAGASEVWRAVILGAGGEWERQQIVVGLADLRGPERAAAVVLALLVAPFLEELLFRGFLQPLLVQNLREVGGIATTSLIFAAMHGRDAFLPIFVLSIALGAVALRTHRLAGPFALHAAFNGITLAFYYMDPNAVDGALS